MCDSHMESFHLNCECWIVENNKIVLFFSDFPSYFPSMLYVWGRFTIESHENGSKHMNRKETNALGKRIENMVWMMKVNREYIYMRKIPWNGIIVNEKWKNACVLFANVMPIFLVIIFQCNLFSWCWILFHVSRKPFAIHKYLTSYSTLYTTTYGCSGVRYFLAFQTTTDISLNKTNWTCVRRSHKINDFTFNKMQIKFSEPQLLYFTSGLHFIHCHELNLNVKLEVYKSESIFHFNISVTHLNDLRFSDWVSIKWREY